MKKICILDSSTLGDVDLSAFKKFGNVKIYATSAPFEVIDRIKEADIIIANKVVLNVENLKYAKNTSLICLTATGTNNIDLEYCKKNNIAVTNVAGYSTNTVVQHTFALFFYLCEKLSYYDSYVKSNSYSKSPIFTNLDKSFNELYGKTWGIIGLGTIGKTVANIATNFGCNVVYYSTSGKNNNHSYERVTLDTLLSISDVISIHAPLNSMTHNLMNYERFKLMKKSSILLNLGRGPIVNEYDLSRALNEDLISSAGLDVLEYEPIRENNPLLKIKNKEKLIITPHIAWASVEARTRLVNEVLLNIDAFINNEKRNRIC